MTRPTTYLGVGAIAALGAGWLVLSGDDSVSEDMEVASLIVPALTPEQETGRTLFEANCAVCHGVKPQALVRGPGVGPEPHRGADPDVENAMKNDIDDYIFDVIRSEHDVPIAPEAIDALIDRLLMVARRQAA